MSQRVLNNDYGLAEMQEDLMITLDTLDDICRNNKIYIGVACSEQKDRL